MNSEWTSAKISLDKLFELLVCGKCKQTPDRPTRFATCGHFFCDTCIGNDSACAKCKMPVKPKDVQTHHVATQLIYYAKILMKMIAQIDIKDFEPLAKSINEFCAKQNNIVCDSDPDSEDIVEPSQDYKCSRIHKTKKENTMTENSARINEEKDAKEDELEALTLRNSILLSQRRNSKDSEPETLGYRNSTPFGQRKNANDSDTETLGFRDCSPINRYRKHKDFEPETIGYRDRSPVNKSQTKIDPDTETLGYIEPTPINQWLDTMEMESENVVTQKDKLQDEQNKNDTLIPDSDEESENEENLLKGIVIPETVVETQNYHDTTEPDKLADLPPESMESLEPIKCKKLVLKTNGGNHKNIDKETLEVAEKNFNIEFCNHETYTIFDRVDSDVETEETTEKESETRKSVIERKINLRLKKQKERAASSHDTLTVPITTMEIDNSIEESTSKEAKFTNASDINRASTSVSENKEENVSSRRLKSVENLHTESVLDVQKKVAKEKIVKLKEDRKSLDRQKKITKLIPKNMNKRNAKGETALHTACVKGQKDFVKSLLEAGANPNTKDNANWTPLQEAVSFGRKEICEMLLQSGASANTPGMDNRTALHEASTNDRIEEAALLLRYNGNKNVYDKYGRRPIDYAVSDRMRELLRSENEKETTPIDSMSLNSLLDQSIVTPNAKLVVLPSNLDTNNSKLLMQLASKLKITLTTAFRPAVTHVVVEANDRNITQLSHYVILAILHGKWILNSQWITIGTDLNDMSEIDFELFEVRGAPNPGTPARARLNEEKQNPRLFNNCFFYFTIGVRGTWRYGKLDFSKDSLATLILAGQGEILKREPDPEDVKDYKLTPFHVAHEPTHPLHRCSHYIIYMPGKDEPRIKYNMPHIKTLPLAWLLECVEKFSLIDPASIGIS